MRGLDGNFESTVGPKTRHGAHKVPQKVSKNCFLGAPRVTFECFRHDICFVQKHTIYYGLTTFYVSGPLLVPSKVDLDTQYAPEVFSSFLLRYFWRPRDAQGRSKAGPRSRKGATRTPQGIPGTPKNRHKISVGEYLLSQGRPGGCRGTHRKEIDTKIY